ncbi:hypothetical protein FHS72_002717 [Loktanella ponticola]|uniref:Uncharacterized protein n=1 Tax=Yoonia ponticola TaxID=1524255 RepID=A0A7W9BMA9_9RHOB|nr:hypothetical protein [Yoonia ponticola]MBB5723080.1 hypothetical protein [Yoonia ponticola]
MKRIASSAHSFASFAPKLDDIPTGDRGIEMLKGIRAMPSLSTLLKSAALASVTAFAATSAHAQDYTVYVYEKGYFPNVIYTDGITRIRFVNKTRYSVGLDTEQSRQIIENRIYSGNSAYVELSKIAGRTLATPYLYNVGRYNARELDFVAGVAPDS